MKTNYLCLSIIAAALPLMAGNFTISSQSDNASYRDKPVKLHEIVPAGGMLITQEKPINVVFSELHLTIQTECATFTTENVAKVLANSRLKVTEVDNNNTGIDRVSTIKLTLIQGRILFALTHTTAVSKFEIKTAFGIITAGVGRFEVNTNGVKVIAGTVRLLVPNAEPVIITGGHAWQNGLLDYDSKSDSTDWDNVQVLFPEVMPFYSDGTQVYVSPVKH